MTDFKRAPSLNDEPLLIKAQAEIVHEHLSNKEACRTSQYRINCLGCVNTNCRSIINPVVPYISLKNELLLQNSDK
jgi:hypothetical protein